MGLIFGIFQISAGIYCILFFGGRIKPKFKNDDQKNQYLSVKTKYGKLLIICGYIIIVTGVMSIINTFI